MQRQHEAGSTGWWRSESSAVSREHAEAWILNLNIIHLKSDSPLRAKAADNTYKHTLTHRCIVPTLSLINTNNPLERSCIAATKHMQ